LFNWEKEVITTNEREEVKGSVRETFAKLGDSELGGLICHIDQLQDKVHKAYGHVGENGKQNMQSFQLVDEEKNI
jgi:hypothetical protein